MKHTGWKAGCGFHRHNPALTCSVRITSGVVRVKTESEARLIAAAPDLLEALTEARLTLSLTRTNIMVEVKKSEGAAYRWEGVPELLANRIAHIDAAITRATGDRPEKGGAL